MRGVLIEDSMEGISKVLIKKVIEMLWLNFIKSTIAQI